MPWLERKEDEMEVTKATNAQELLMECGTLVVAPSKKLAAFAEKVLEDHSEEFRRIRDNDIDIGYMVSSKVKKQKGRIIFADCKKVPSDWKWCCPHDFLITVYVHNCADMTDEQLDTLIWHELKHVGVEDGLNDPKLYVVPHDVQDFREILETHGVDWAIQRSI